MEIGKIAFIILGVLVLVVFSRTATITPVPVDYEALMEVEAGKLRNDSAEGSFNMPEAEISEEMAFGFYNVSLSSDGEDDFDLKFVSSIGYYRPYPYGFCPNGPLWGVHFVYGYFYWPPIARRVCARPCSIFGHRCRSSCCDTPCLYRYMWQCFSSPTLGYYCRSIGYKHLCYEQHNCCKCTCAYSSIYCNIGYS